MSHFISDNLHQIWNLVIDLNSLKSGQWRHVYLANNMVIAQILFYPQWLSTFSSMWIRDKWIQMDYVYFAIWQKNIIPTKKQIDKAQIWLRKQELWADVMFYNQQGYFSMVEAGLWENKG